MLYEKLKKYNVILGSASERRKELLSKLGIDFYIKTTNKKELYPENLKINEIPIFLAKQKANIIKKDLKKNYLLITADTIVVKNKEVIHKPKNEQDAIKTLKMLSGRSHKVITGVCITSSKKQISFSSITNVLFTNLSHNDIAFYVDTFNPFDKAGSYGIQDWIGSIGIEKIIGSYNNVVGLPTTKLYQKLKLFT